MKNLKHLKKLSNLVDESLTEIKQELDKIKKEHQKKVLTANLNLLKEIANGENLDELSLIEKYLDKKSKKLKESEKSIVDEKDEEILNHMNLDGNDYFYEDKVNGNVYDNSSKRVGVFKLGNIEFC